MRRIAVIALALGLLMSLAAPALTAHAAGPLLSLTAEPAEVRPGETVTVTAALADIANLYGFELHLSFDPALLQVVSPGNGKAGVAGTLIEHDFVAQNQFDNALGTLDYATAQISPHEPVTGTGTLALFQFRAVAAGRARIKIGSSILSDIDGMALQATVVGADVTVLGAAGETPASPTGAAPTSAPTSSAASPTQAAPPTAPAGEATATPRPSAGSAVSTPAPVATTAAGSAPPVAPTAMPGAVVATPVMQAVVPGGVATPDSAGLPAVSGEAPARPLPADAPEQPAPDQPTPAAVAAAESVVQAAAPPNAARVGAPAAAPALEPPVRVEARTAGIRQTGRERYLIAGGVCLALAAALGFAAWLTRRAAPGKARAR